MGLNESCSAIREQVLLMNPLPGVTKAYSSMAQEEKQRGFGSAREMTETAATTVQRNEHVILGVIQQGYSSHSNSSNRKILRCSCCDQDHHVREKCWRFNGYPPGHPEHKPNQRVNRFKNDNIIHPLANQSSSTNMKEVPMMQEMRSIINGLNKFLYDLKQASRL